jgi:hypothetical protein
LWDTGDLPQFPQGGVDFSAGFGDSISFGATSSIRSGLGTDSVVNKNSGAYTSGVVAGAALTVGLYANAAIPNSLTHFTNARGAAGIVANGMRAGGGLFGKGVYATTIGRPFNLFVPATSTIPLKISSDGFIRIIPSLVYLKGGSLVTAGWGLTAVALISKKHIGIPCKK